MPSTSSRSINRPFANNEPWVEASPATLDRISPLLLSDAFNSTRSQPCSLASASLITVFPTPGGPQRRIALFWGVPVFQDASHLTICSMACLLPATSARYLGRCLTVQGSAGLSIVAVLRLLLQKALPIARSTELPRPRLERAESLRRQSLRSCLSASPLGS